MSDFETTDLTGAQLSLLLDAEKEPVALFAGQHRTARSLAAKGWGCIGDDGRFHISFDALTALMDDHDFYREIDDMCAAAEAGKDATRD